MKADLEDLIWHIRNCKLQTELGGVAESKEKGRVSLAWMPTAQNDSGKRDKALARTHALREHEDLGQDEMTTSERGECALTVSAIYRVATTFTPASRARGFSPVAQAISR
jgi:hypothetical protein